MPHNGDIILVGKIVFIRETQILKNTTFTRTSKICQEKP